jgi:serine/threonine protein kinase
MMHGDGRLLALKVLNKLFLSDQGMVDRTKLEAEILREVNHANVSHLLYSF